jgi:hypothetical protein
MENKSNNQSTWESFKLFLKKIFQSKKREKQELKSAIQKFYSVELFVKTRNKNLIFL